MTRVEKYDCVSVTQSSVRLAGWRGSNLNAVIFLDAVNVMAVITFTWDFTCLYL